MIKILLPALLFVSLQAYAEEVNDMYAERELVHAQARYERRIDELFSQRLWSLMKEEERRALPDVRILLPLKGNGPLNAFSGRIDGIPTVVLPVLTLKFIEDLSMAYAWRHVYQYSLEPIDEYLAMLKYRRPGDFPGSRLPNPLTALGVPARIWEKDTRVDDLSLRFRNTAWAFILAHELEHLRRRHPGNGSVPAKVSQRHEQEADAFAVELFRRSDEIPMGMILWFQASVGYFPNRADFRSEAEYRDWLRGKLNHPRWGSATHPMNPGRGDQSVGG
ncbi:M48 family metalloprotease [Methylohalobius crimeensis]|uniref:hypothetical protein n=1 Tax=Methylohalobius crimeensis TaxID=244365 RepID=UPI0003B76103|nr:hypothetical protein [Methylohalobius crimeensis]